MKNSYEQLKTKYSKVKQKLLRLNNENDFYNKRLFIIPICY